jgi:hypothetical protein
MVANEFPNAKNMKTFTDSGGMINILFLSIVDDETIEEMLALARVFVQEDIQCIGFDANGLRRRARDIVGGLLHAKQLIGYAHVCQTVETLPATIIRNEIYSF